MSEAAPEVVRERIVRWADPHASATQTHGLSGLEALRAIVSGAIAPPPMVALLGMSLTEVDEGRAVFEADPGEHLYNPIGMVHGGFACTILDSAMGCAVHSTLPVGTGYSTTDVQVRLIRAITISTGRVRAEGRAIHVGRSTAVAEGRLTDANGKLLATATTACAIVRP